MSAIDVLENTHLMVIHTLEDLQEREWDVVGVVGEWSVKDILASLTGDELLLLDVLKTFQGEQATPYMLRYAQSKDQFVEDAIKARQYQTPQHVLQEYQDTQVQTASLLTQLPAERVEQKGTLSWYNVDLSLADLINSLSSETRELCEQIRRFRDERGQELKQ